MTSLGSQHLRIVLDCRWLGIGGAGRVTELLLRGLAAEPPPGCWVLWGPATVEPLAWPGAELRPVGADPRALAGQRLWNAIPPSDLAMFLHQMRPLRPVPSLTWVYDTIPLRFSRGAAGRAARRLFLRRVVAMSRRIITTSHYAKGCIERDLGVAGGRVVVVTLPFDHDFADRVTRMRAERPPVDVALYVGRFAPHKNLPRLLSAFAQTEFRKQGGKLLLIGGDEGDLAALGRPLGSEERGYVELRSHCTQDELEQLFATCRLGVQPSLEEGFGLPAWEALCCGLPLCVSDGGALREITRGLVAPFRADSVDAMSAAIDDCAVRARACPSHAVELSGTLKTQAPTVRAFAEQVQQVVRDAVQGEDAV